MANFRRYGRELNKSLGLRRRWQQEPTSESDMYRGKVLRKVPAKASRLCKPSEAVL